ncbi:MAG: DarT ssDNA thymidine ADP-ribosyltransferase family protein [Ilumatobacter sp.]|uniref:DarT ssDNA thymidine ADP-ribosyltransferase family protein n=1 Tax=Ilumatobacter sp. TaxID=1967498 RepID=UPI0032971DF6
MVQAARARGVTEVLHFTRLQQGALGILSSQMIKTRRTLPDDKHLEHVYEPNSVNAQRNRDLPWHDYVNLSVTRINPRMFDYSQRTHAHPDTSWCIFTFEIDVLAAPGGVFTTTNNTYSGVRRSEGVNGFEAMFGPHIHRYNDVSVTRPDDRQLNEPTDPQAEFLHLGDLDLAHLTRISTQTEEGSETIHGMLGVFPTDCHVEHSPERFS